MYSFWKRYLRPITPAVLLVFTWYSSEPWNYLQASQISPVPRPAAAPPSAPVSPSGGGLDGVVAGLDTALGELSLQVSRDEGKRLAALDRLAELHRQLDAADADARADFGAMRTRLGTAGLPPEVLDRHRKAVASYDAQIRTLRQSLERVEGLARALPQAKEKGAQGKREALRRAIGQAQTQLRKRSAPRLHYPLDPNALPHRAVKSRDRKPFLQKGEIDRLLGVKPGTLKTLKAAQPAPADLAPNEDVQITPAISSLANDLGRDPSRIYRWVHDNVEIIPTYGSIQGSQMTLQSKRGNAFDTATLLVALLRAAGVPARYVVGTVEVPTPKVLSWLGGVESAQVAQQLLGQGGIPNVGLIQGAEIARIRIQHVWVQAWVDYVPSRGAKGSQGDTWVALDPSFKLHQLTPSSGLFTAQPFNLGGLSSQLLAQAQVDPSLGRIANISEDTILNAMNDYGEAAGSYFMAQGLQPSREALLGGKTIVPETATVLPASLPYTVVTAGEPVSTLPDSLRLGVTLNGFASSLDRALGDPSFSYRISLPALNSRRLGITYEPVSATDAQIIQNAVDSGASSLPVYLINVRPVVTLDGEAVASGPGVGMGSSQFVDVLLKDVDETSTLSYQVAAGDEIVFGVTANGVAQEVVQARFIAVPSNTGAENLHQAALHYWMESSFFDELTASSLGVHAVRRLSAGLFSCPLTVSYFFGAPRSGFYASRIMDVKRSLVGVAGQDPERVVSFVKESGMAGSFLEGLVFDQLFSKNRVSRGFSAMELIGDANRRGIPIYSINQANAAAVLPLLSVSSAVKSDITNAVGTGKTVLIPEREMNRGSWHGVGYIVQDETTGAAAYLISGGLSGGSWLDCHPAVKVLLEVIAFIILAIILILIIAAILESLGSLGPVLQPAFAAIIALMALLVGTTPAYAAGGYQKGGQADPCNCPPLPDPPECQYHTDHSHFPCILPITHWHYFTVHQGPAPDCKINVNRRFGGCGPPPVPCPP
jgi:transglutaminase-like putative cysteine protease